MARDQKSSDSYDTCWGNYPLDAMSNILLAYGALATSFAPLDPRIVFVGLRIERVRRPVSRKRFAECLSADRPDPFGIHQQFIGSCYRLILMAACTVVWGEEERDSR